MKDDFLQRGVEEIIVRADLAKQLRGRRKLRIKYGVDPTGARLHIGHAIPYWKLRQFQALGHHVIILIGDFTAAIGDPSDKAAERQPLSPADVKHNLKTYLEQIGRMIDLKKAEVRYNSEWLAKLSFADVLELAAHFKVAQMLERDNFAKRYAAGKPIGLQEFLYPLMQGYDSVALHADVEIGGNDQLFNMMAGRTLQKAYGQTPQNVMVFELLIGNDGRKMSKSIGNCIYLDDSPEQMYGKVMAVHDDLIIHYYKLATDMPLGQVAQIEQNLAAGDSPRDAKAALARQIVARYHGEDAALTAEATWNRQFRDKQLPARVPSLRLSKTRPPILLEVLTEHFQLSNSEARRLLEQNGVRVDGQVVTDAGFMAYRDGSVVQVGKRRFVKIKLQ